MKFSYTFPELKKWIEGSKHDKVSRVSTFASLVELMRQPRCCMKAEASKVVTMNITGKHTTNVHPASDWCDGQAYQVTPKGPAAAQGTNDTIHRAIQCTGDPDLPWWRRGKVLWSHAWNERQSGNGSIYTYTRNVTRATSRQRQWIRWSFLSCPRSAAYQCAGKSDIPLVSMFVFPAVTARPQWLTPPKGSV